MNSMSCPSISVVVPVYNCERYLSQLIDSVLSQTFVNFELLLVDDGSTDESSCICDRYASLDDRVKAYHKENGGVSDARNYGIDRCSGEYVFFADSDDYLYPDCLEMMFREAQGYDLLICSYDSGLRKDITPSKANRFTDGGVCGNNLDEIRNKDIIYKLGYSNFVVWTQLFKRNLINENHLRFKKIYSEDEFFCYEFLLHVNAVKKINYQGYYYISNPDSLSSFHKSIAEMDYIEKMEQLYDNLIVRFQIANKEYIWSLFRRIAWRYVAYIHKGYFKDTRVNYLSRVRRWTMVRQREWIHKKIPMSIIPYPTKIVLFICKMRLYYILDPLFVGVEWFREKR